MKYPLGKCHIGAIAKVVKIKEKNETIFIKCIVPTTYFCDSCYGASQYIWEVVTPDGNKWHACCGVCEQAILSAGGMVPPVDQDKIAAAYPHDPFIKAVVALKPHKLMYPCGTVA